MLRAIAAVSLLLTSCGGSAESVPCASGAPGIRFVIHTPHAYAVQGILQVQFANGMAHDFITDLPAGDYPSGVVEFTVAYPASASRGPAAFYFYTRPDPGRQGSGQVNVDLEACTDIEIFTIGLDIDAGVADAAWP